MTLRQFSIAAGFMLAGSFAPVAAAPVEIDVAAYERTSANDEMEGALPYPAIYACEYGDRANGIAVPAVGCALAYENALSLQRFDEALRYSALGCEKYGNASACRAASRLPMHMGNNSLSVPTRYLAEMKRLAAVVCHSGKRITNEFSGDVTGRECANFARHFTLARDVEYKHALQPAARAYYESALDPRLAMDLAAASCKGWGERAGCEQLRIASRLSDEKQVKRAGNTAQAVAAAPAKVSTAPNVAR